MEAVDDAYAVGPAVMLLFLPPGCTFISDRGF